MDADEYEIGWWLAPTAWGRGLAREGAAAVRDEAFTASAPPASWRGSRPPTRARWLSPQRSASSHESDSIGRAGEPFSVLRLTAARWQRA